MPILISAVLVWIASALAWMIMPHHRGDFKPLPNEDAAMSAVRNLAIPPGVYFFPHMKDCKAMKTDPVAKEKFEKGPHGLVQIWPPEAFGNMGRNMLLSFIFYVVVGVFVAYLGTHTLAAGSAYLKVFQVTGTAAIMAYCFASIPHGIWFGTPLRNMLAALADGIVYGLLTAGTFSWLWPDGAALPMP
jgi:hypothetical protein